MFNDSTLDKDDMTVGVGHSRRYCNTGYDQSQGRRPSTRKCIGLISQRRYRASTIPSEINPKPGQQIEKRWSLLAVCAIPGRPDREIESQTETIIAERDLLRILCPRTDMVINSILRFAQINSRSLQYTIYHSKEHIHRITMHENNKN